MKNYQRKEFFPMAQSAYRTSTETQQQRVHLKCAEISNLYQLIAAWPVGDCPRKVIVMYEQCSGYRQDCLQGWDGSLYLEFYRSSLEVNGFEEVCALISALEHHFEFLTVEAHILNELFGTSLSGRVPPAYFHRTTSEPYFFIHEGDPKRYRLLSQSAILKEWENHQSVQLKAS